MYDKIIETLKNYTPDIDAFLARYCIDDIINTIEFGEIVINEECTQELNEII